MYNETKAKGGKLVIFAIIGVVVVGIIIAVIVGVNNKADEAEATKNKQDDMTQDIIDGVYGR